MTPDVFLLHVTDVRLLEIAAVNDLKSFALSVNLPGSVLGICLGYILVFAFLSDSDFAAHKRWLYDRMLVERDEQEEELLETRHYICEEHRLPSGLVIPVDFNRRGQLFWIEPGMTEPAQYWNQSSLAWVPSEPLR
jgi:hypothetical protein